MSATTVGRYLYHSTFENATSDWKGRGSSTVAQSSKECYEGENALFVSGRTDSWNGAEMPLSASSYVPGESYDFSVAVCPDSSGTTEMMLSLQYTYNEETVYDHLASRTVSGKKWGVLFASAYTIPTNASDVLLYVETAKGSSSFYIDEVIIGNPGTVPPALPFGTNIVGDIDDNKIINVMDTLFLKRYLLSQKLDAPSSADIDGNLEFSCEDMRMLCDFQLCKRTAFPERQIPPQPEDNFDYDPNLLFKAAPDSYRNPCSQSGTITKMNYTSCHGGKATSANVYLPYGYNQNDTSKKYNVFYLMHGGGENQDTIFSDDVKLQYILDNMIMNKVMEPLIVVTPTFNCGDVSNFYQELLQNLIPLVETKYNTYAKSSSAEDLKASRYHRGFGGFSMGSVCTWHCYLNALDYIAYFMPLSGDSWVGASSADKAKILADHAKNSGYAPDQYFIFCATGIKDIAYPNISPQVDEMKKYTDQFIYTSDFSQGNFYFLTWNDGVHWWGNVVHYVYDVLPYFFHEHQAD